MRLFNLIRASRRELDGLHHDAEHMLDKYGPDAQAMCQFAIDSTADRKLRRRLKQVLRLLTAEQQAAAAPQPKPLHRAAAWRGLSLRSAGRS